VILWYGVLGPLEVRRPDGSVLPVGGARLRALLGLLLAEPGRVVPVESLIDRLWDDPPAGAGNALQSLVSRLRGVLGAGSVASTAAGYRLVAESVDSLEFSRLAGQGRDALRSGDLPAAVEALDAALRLWRGPAASELPNRLQLEESRLVVVEDLAEARLALGRPTGSGAEQAATAGPGLMVNGPGIGAGGPSLNAGGGVRPGLAELVAAYPLRERLAALHIRSLYAAGHQAEALAAYEKTRQALADELGADPGSQLRDLHLAMLRQDPSLTPPPVRHRSNLPAQLTSFVGRDEDLAAVSAALRRGRLVTLVGAGGAGKTRLAVEAAARAVEHSDVWLVELAPVTDPADVPHAVATTLGVRETRTLPTGRSQRPAAEVDAAERVVAGLRTTRSLLVMDNCEHLIAAAADLGSRILAECPEVTLLATSREPLGITGETLHPVPPLALPPGDDVDPADFAAVKLFVDRAAANHPGFRLDESNAADVVAICRRLDGLPLAIELAAARLRVLSPAQIAERLDDRFRLLTGGSRTALARHQTLRAVVEWSWDLLTEPERTAVRRLSVFAGGISLQAAEQVAGADLDVVASLVDKSLLESDGAGRYRMLETIRAYATERLVETGEAEQIRSRYRDHFIELAERAEPLLRTREQLSWLELLDAEHDNLLAVLRHAVDNRDVVAGLRLVVALGWYWWMRAAHTESVSWARQVLAISDTPPLGYEDTYRTVRFLSLAADWPDLVTAIGDATAYLREMPPGQPRHPLVLMREAFALAFAGAVDQAMRVLEAGLASSDPWTVASSYLTRGAFRVNNGEITAAREDLEQAEAGFRELGERWGRVQALTTLSEILGYAGDTDRLYADELGYTDEIPTLLLREAALQIRTGEPEAARATLYEVRRIATRIGDRQALAAVIVGEGELERFAGNLAAAADLYQQAIEMSQAASPTAPPQFRAMMYAWLARVALAEADTDRARRLYLDALADEQLRWDRPVTAGMLDGLGLVELAAGDAGRAAVLFGAAVMVRGMPDDGDAEVVAGREAARRALGGSAYSREFQRGTALSFDAALDLARA
jgi:predicted ATPase